MSHFSHLSLRGWSLIALWVSTDDTYYKASDCSGHLVTPCIFKHQQVFKGLSPELNDQIFLHLSSTLAFGEIRLLQAQGVFVHLYIRIHM